MAASKKKSLTELAAVIAEHQANLTRLGEAWGEKLTDQLDAADLAILGNLERILSKAKRTYRVNEKGARDALDYVRQEVEKIRVKAYKKAEEQMRSEAELLAGNEQKWTRKLLSSMTGTPTSGFNGYGDEKIVGIIENGVIRDNPWNRWWVYYTESDTERISHVINRTMAEGLTIDECVRLLMGTKANNYTDGVLSTNRRSARNMARTLCSGIANLAKDEFYRENDDVVTAVEWLDTLDGRTCLTCAGMSRMRWKIDEPHPVPPAHFQCRCCLIPVTVITDEGEDMPRPMANADFMAEAKRAYEAKYPGKMFDDLAESTKKKYYWKAMQDYESRTGKKAYSRAPGSMSFRDYFLQMSEQQKKDYLGPQKYALWKTGKYTVEDFIPPYPNKAFTVKELKALDQQSFKI